MRHGSTAALSLHRTCNYSCALTADRWLTAPRKNWTVEDRACLAEVISSDQGMAGVAGMASMDDACTPVEECLGQGASGRVRWRQGECG